MRQHKHEFSQRNQAWPKLEGSVMIRTTSTPKAIMFIPQPIQTMEVCQSGLLRNAGMEPTHSVNHDAVRVLIMGVLLGGYERDNCLRGS
jgi:hypothetical protein